MSDFPVSTPRRRLGRAALAIVLLFADPAESADTVAELVRQVRPSIVLLRTGETRIDYTRLADRTHIEPESAGTGFVVDAAGYIVTNNHVVLLHLEWPDPAIRAALPDGQEVPAKLIGRDELSDLDVVLEP